MVAPGMRRYRIRTAAHAALVGERGDGPIDPAALFPRVAPLRIEIGCGHGEFLSQLAAAHPDENLIGNEWDELRVTKIAHKCTKEGVANARIFGGEAQRFLRRLPSACASRIYVLFPDPWPKAGHRRRRLMHRDVLIELSRVAAPGCRFVFASDTHNYVMQVLSNLSTLPGLWRNCYLPAGYRIDIPTRFPTVFERHKKAEGCTIAYLLLERSEVSAPATLPALDRSPRQDPA
jgi:tRNA (guanine-N7-)-methyltransferase